jgi:hypothetical protein
MSQIKLESNQAAIIISVSSEGDVTVDAAFPEAADQEGDFAAGLCTVIGQKLTEDEDFQGELMAALAEKED